MTANDVERARQLLKTFDLGSGVPENQVDGNALCELALDGLRFRAWINGASSPECHKLCVAIAPCIQPNQYRTAIDGLIAKGVIRP